MKQYIKPTIFCIGVDLQTSLLEGSNKEPSQVPGGLAKKNDFLFEDETWGDSSWPKSKSAWEE